MIGLDGKVEDAKGAVAASGESAAQMREDVVRAERGECASRAQGDVNRMAVVVLGPTNMGRAGPGAGGFAASAWATSTPGGGCRQIELSGPMACHLDSADISATECPGCAGPVNLIRQQSPSGEGDRRDRAEWNLGSFMDGAPCGGMTKEVHDGFTRARRQLFETSDLSPCATTILWSC